MPRLGYKDSLRIMKSRLSSSPSGMRNAIKVRLDDKTRAQFQKIARSKHKRESELLRELILMAINKPTHRKDKSLQNSAEPEAMRRTTVWMPTFVLNAAKTRSRTKGMSLSRWIASLIQSNLTTIPVITNHEIQVLRECNYELAAIGRNLNQIARILNADRTETGRLKLSMIDVLQSSLSRTQRAVRTLIRASNNVWSVEDAFGHD